jgi:nitrogenase molybdenum-iron protein alpha/beta subunit
VGVAWKCDESKAHKVIHTALRNLTFFLENWGAAENQLRCRTNLWPGGIPSPTRSCPWLRPSPGAQPLAHGSRGCDRLFWKLMNRTSISASTPGSLPVPAPGTGIEPRGQLEGERERGTRSLDSLSLKTTKCGFHLEMR